MVRDSSSIRCLAALIALLLAASGAGQDELQLAVSPERVSLAGPRQQCQLVVTAARHERQSDATREAAYRVADPNIATVSAAGRVTPKADGLTTVEVAVGGRTRTIRVEVRGMQQSPPVSFDHDVLPVFAKAGCSGGSCHGAPNGKAGFQLSLFASDPDLDRLSVSRRAGGRRVNLIDPAQSLLLLKPTMRVAHQGGRRLDRDGPLYRLLHDWIAEGCQVEQAEAPCVGIDVYPDAERVLTSPHHTQQFRVEARFADGSSRDVTRLAKFDSSDENVAYVTAEGQAVGVDRGELAVIVRFREFIRAPRLTLVRDIQGFDWPDPPAANYVDQHVHAKLRQLQYSPSERCSDAVFVRRVYLDVIGLLPTRKEAEKFLADTAADKRPRLINELLERPEHARFWAQKWGDLLRVSRKQIGARGVLKFNRWLRTAVGGDMPSDQFARELLASAGSTRVHPAGNYYRAAGDTNDAMETTAQLFLGTRIQCAKCHNHPFERWTQDNYYGLASVFQRLQRKKTGRGDEVFLWTADEGETKNPRNGQDAEPWAPAHGPLRVGPGQDRREAFVDWLTSRDNPFFARVEVNRIWAQVMGRGIVEPFDDFRDSNPPSNAPLLDALASDFSAHGYSRRHVLRTILNSETYQASSTPSDGNRDDVKYFSHYPPRRLTAEQLADALGQTTGAPKQFQHVPLGTKATWLPAPDLVPHDRNKIGDIEFLKVFGQPERQSVCECERGDDSSLGQALELLNGKFLQEMLASDLTVYRKALAAKQPVEQIVTELYWRALARPPSESELRASLNYAQAAADQQSALEDICWAIVNKDEFLFQH